VDITSILKDKEPAITNTHTQDSLNSLWNIQLRSSFKCNDVAIVEVIIYNNYSCNRLEELPDYTQNTINVNHAKQ
jgi:hypothetical protein